MFSVEEIRKDFPILCQKVYNKPLVYFDNAATTQKPNVVLEKIQSAYTTQNANIHRGVHFLSQKATEEHENARAYVAQYINAPKSCEVIFTRGTTEAINLVANSFCERFCDRGDEIILSEMEHHSNIVPWQLVAEKKGLKLKIIKLNALGELDLEHYESLFSEKTKIVSVAHVSNVLGTINPIKTIVQIAHQKGVKVLVDGAQAIPHLEVNVRDLDVDFYAFSGHKVYAPTGIGVLYGKEDLLNLLPPYQGGGEMIDRVSFSRTTYNELPYKFEAGTPDYVGSTALAEALRYLSFFGLENVRAHEYELLSYATQRLMEVEGVLIIGTSHEKSGVISFVVSDIHPYDIGMLLDKLGIAVRTGHHCAQPLMDSLGISGTVRMSFAVYNTKTEIDIFIDALKRVVAMLS